MKIKINISTCPNDTFMFDAMLHGRIDTEGLEFSLHMADIEQLNAILLDSGDVDVSKMSYAVYPLIADRYKLLRAGGALGFGSGPLLVGKQKIYPDELASVSIAIPGVHTTANALLNTVYPDARNKKSYLFSDIMEAVLTGEADAGVLIHETRFLYKERGLRLIADLGQEWEKLTRLPVPLGGIAVSRQLDEPTQQKINKVLRKSIEHAFRHPADAYPFVREHAQEMREEVIREHIRMFVNDFSVDPGEKGEKAVATLLEKNGFTSINDIFV